MVMGAQHKEVFEDRVRPGGLMLLEASGVKEKLARDDIEIEYIPALEAATRLGAIQNANLVMLGAYIEITKTLPSELVLEEIEKRFGGKGWERVTAAKEAFLKGISLIAK